jgi:hypothetical protein
VVPRDLVIQLTSILELSDGAFLVGGQALNVWAERYSSASELAYYGPYTSKDIDYFGHRNAAEKLAHALGGSVSFPDIDNATPQTAIVTADVGDEHLEIDFIGTVLGVEPQQLEKLAVEISAPLKADDSAGEIRIPIMHPLHCLQSRLSNVAILGRTGDLALRQLQASPIVLREYLREMLQLGHLKEVTATTKQLFRYLKTDPNGRRVWKYLSYDLVDILRELRADDRLDERYRDKTLQPMIDRIERVRSLLWPKPVEGLFLTSPEDE